MNQIERALRRIGHALLALTLMACGAERIAVPVEHNLAVGKGDKGTPAQVLRDIANLKAECA